MPSYGMVAKDFMKDVLSGKKDLMKAAEVRPFTNLRRSLRSSCMTRSSPWIAWRGISQNATPRTRLASIMRMNSDIAAAMRR